MDNFYKKLWAFFLIVSIISCFVMAMIFVTNNKIKNSDEASIEEKEAVNGITYALWDEFKILTPTMFFILLVSYWIHIKYKRVLTSEDKA